MLNGFTSVFATTLNNEIQDNLVEFFDWGLLERGNYFNATLGELSPRSQDYSLLKPSSNDNYAPGAAWEGFRKNWVWQSGVSYNPPPIVGSNSNIPGISGVYVNNTFYPSTTSGIYAHKVDYHNGRVVFNTPIPTGSKVQVEHSYKYINVIYASNLPWIREIQYRTLDKSSFFNDNTKGDYELPSEMRVQLPAIAIEIVPNRTFKPYQLGNTGQFIYTDVLFHCIAEDDLTRNKLVDIVSLQNDKIVSIFNTNSIATNNDFPLDFRGYPNPNAKRYPDLISAYNNGAMLLRDTKVQGMEILNSNLYAGIVRMTTEIITTQI